jgi:hypothetical protein
MTSLSWKATKTGGPRITVELNGVKVIDRAEVPANLVENGSGGGNKNTGFLMLQNHNNPVEFRNIWAQTDPVRRETSLTQLSQLLLSQSEPFVRVALASTRPCASQGTFAHAQFLLFSD